MADNGSKISNNSSGFPNPASDGKDMGLDLNDLIVKHPASTFYMRVEGEEYADMDIYTGDIVVIDKSLPVSSGSVVVIVLDGDFIVRNYKVENGKHYLYSSTDNSVEIEQYGSIAVWGVITHVIHSTSSKTRN